MTRRLPILAVTSLLACGGTPKQAPPPPAPPPPAPVAAPADPPPPAFRLPGDVRPRRYALELRIDPAQEDFGGVMRVEAEVVKPTRVVWMNATDLEVSAAALGGEPARVIPGGDDFIGLAVDSELPVGAIAIEIHYRGGIDRERSRGLYSVKEGDLWYAYTFFEPIDARRVFPCWDEPAYKVPWQLTIHAPRGQIALANAPVATETDSDSGHDVVFAASKPLPSYLVAFVVGPFEVVDGGKAGREGIAIRYVIPRGRSGELGWAKTNTPRVVDALEAWFDIPYPYEKLDVAVVPRFWGTMEHPGILAMGQPLTLIRPEQETRARRHRYTSILAHELAHYWFGDLVTAAWWDATWLNEALAAWIDPAITNAVQPEWHVLDDRVLNTAMAMTTDELLAVRRISNPAEDKEQIEASFDNQITYAKGARVLGMFETWVGPEAFQRFIRGYLRRHAWGNASAKDFVDELGAELGGEAATGFETFLTQPGVPLVEHELVCKDKNASLSLRQRRSLPAGTTENEQRLWKFPVCVRHGAGKTQAETCTFMTTASAELALEGPCPKWVIMNAAGRGYYRAAYRADEIKRLLGKGGPAMTRIERLTILGDLVGGIKRAELGIGDGLALIPVLASSPDERLVARAALLTEIADPQQLDDAAYARFQRFVRATFGKQAQKLGWKRQAGDSDDRHEMRNVLVPRVARAGDPALAREAGVLARAWLADPKAVDEDLAEDVLEVAARNGDRALFDALVEAGGKMPSRMDRGRAITALGAFTDPALAAAAREVMLSGKFDLRETSPALMVQLETRETRVEAWKFLRANIEKIAAGLRGDQTANVIAAAMGSLCDATSREQAVTSIGPVAARVEGAKNMYDKHLEGTDQCIARRARTRPDIDRFLSKY